MSERDRLADQFEASRPRMRSLAYRMLGSYSEADDAVQETWLRLDRTDSDSVDNLGGWLTTVIGRICLDRLRARRSQPQAPPDEHANDLAAPDDGEDDPAHHALVAESVGAAMLVVLESLGPAERVAFVLHDVFAVPFDQVAEILDRTPEATRQLASRARRRVQGRSPAGDVDPTRQRRLVDAFLRAARGGDFDALLAVLAPQIELRVDAAAERMGALRSTQGAEAIARTLAGGAHAARLAVVDGLAGLVWAPGGRTRGVIEFTVVHDRIVAIDVIGDPERIESLDVVVLDA